MLCRNGCDVCVVWSEEQKVLFAVEQKPALANKETYLVERKDKTKASTTHAQFRSRELNPTNILDPKNTRETL